MNERIRELAEQAGIHFHKGGTLDAGPNGIAKFVLYSDIEKFAELIVRDCASICELNGRSYKHSFTPVKAKLAESTSEYCGTLIKKHFGVKE